MKACEGDQDRWQVLQMEFSGFLLNAKIYYR